MNQHQIDFGHGRHPGCKRKHNEDNYTIDPDLGLWVVADGMGGHDCGEIASRITVDYIHDAIKREAALVDSIERAHKIILMAASQNIGMPGMGSTVVALSLHDDIYEIAWVGDSRAYLWSDDQLDQLTRDHSYVQQMFDSGKISKEEAASHPQRNMIIQALGAADMETVKVDRITDTFYRGQQILLCSDGLTDELTDREIAQVLSSELGEQEKVDRLIELAIDHGGSDNITVIVLSASGDAPLMSNEDETLRIAVEK
jgi:protein phosphatase